MKTIEQLNSELDADLPRSAVKERSGGGSKSLSYVEGHYVIDRLNKVLGNLGWDHEVIELVQVEADKPTYRCRVRITATVEVAPGQYLSVKKEGIGWGADKSGLNPHEMAVKEAETDALKRAGMKFGMSLGLALYNKDQPNVTDYSTEAITKEWAKDRQALRDDVAASRQEGPAPSRPSAPAPSRPTLASAPAVSDRATLNKTINTLSKIVVSKGAGSVDTIKADMRAKYGTDEKEKLSDAQAAELKASLEKLAG